MSAKPSHAIRIDPANGDVHIHGFALPLSPRLARDDVESRFAALAGDSRDHGNGYAWLSLQGPLTLGQMPAGMSLCFFHGHLEVVTLGVSLPDDEEEDRWPTEPTILRHVAFLQRELAKQLGKPLDHGQAEFPWGAAWARFDLKGFMATSGVSYRTRARDDGASR